MSHKTDDPELARQLRKIEDPHLTTFLAVLAQRINLDMDLVDDYAHIYGAAYRPVQNIRLKDPNKGEFVEGGNTDLPGLFAWRKTNEYYSFTNSTRLCKALCGFKYMLPANKDIEQGVATLNRVALAIDGAAHDMFEDQHGGDILEKAQIVSWAVRWTAKFTYNGPNGQGLYPVMEADLTFEHEANPFDSSFLPQMLGLLVDWNLKGAWSDGDEAPKINPILQQALPEKTPQSPPPLSPEPFYYRRRYRGMIP